MSVRRLPSGFVVVVVVQSISREPYALPMIFGMWVGLRPKVHMLNFLAWHMLIKYLICIIYLKTGIFLSGAFLGNCVPYLDDFWHAAGLVHKVSMLNFWAWHMLVPFNRWGQKFQTMLYYYQTW